MNQFNDQLPVGLLASLRGGGGKGGSHHEFTNNNFVFHKSQNKYLRFHRKPAVGGSEYTEVCNYIKRLKREVKSSRYFLQSIFNVCVHNLGFWQFTFNRVHFNHDSWNSFSVHHDSRTKWSITVSRK